MITDGQQTISDQLCCMPDRFSEISGQIRFEIHYFIVISRPLS